MVSQCHCCSRLPCCQLVDVTSPPSPLSRSKIHWPAAMCPFVKIFWPFVFCCASVILTWKEWRVRMWYRKWENLELCVFIFCKWSEGWSMVQWWDPNHIYTQLITSWCLSLAKILCQFTHTILTYMQCFDGHFGALLNFLPPFVIGVGFFSVTQSAVLKPNVMLLTGRKKKQHQKYNLALWR